MAMSNDGFILPMTEEYEFMDNIDDIMEIPGIDSINFSPADFSLHPSA